MLRFHKLLLAIQTRLLKPAMKRQKTVTDCA